MIFTATILPLLAATAALASPVADERRNNGGSSASTCKTFYADITATANNTDLRSVLGGPPANQQALIQSSIDYYKAGSTVQQRLFAAPMKSVSGTYRLWFEYCAPSSGTPRGIFQTAHGNAGYWNVRLNGDSSYSFAESAAAAGWATLSYDRLGVGRSAHPDGLDVVQIAYEIAQAAAITTALRAGTLSDLGRFSKVVGVGHSYGSFMMIGAAAVAPNIFDAVVLTGFTANVTSGPLGLAGFQSTIANVAYPNRFGNLPNDYVITPTQSNDQIGFFTYPNYTQTAIDSFTASKGEYTLGQQNSIAGPLFLSRQNFNRPVFVLTGNGDTPFCAANCTLSSYPNGTQLDTVRMLFPSVAASDLTTYVVPATGHAISFHPTAYNAYQQVIKFVQKVGL